MPIVLSTHCIVNINSFIYRKGFKIKNKKSGQYFNIPLSVQELKKKFEKGRGNGGEKEGIIFVKLKRSIIFIPSRQKPAYDCFHSVYWVFNLINTEQQTIHNKTKPFKLFFLYCYLLCFFLSIKYYSFFCLLGVFFPLSFKKKFNLSCSISNNGLFQILGEIIWEYFNNKSGCIIISVYFSRIDRGSKKNAGISTRVKS